MSHSLYELGCPNEPGHVAYRRFAEAKLTTKDGPIASHVRDAADGWRRFGWRMSEAAILERRGKAPCSHAVVIDL
jgi:hypothetical protein